MKINYEKAREAVVIVGKGTTDEKLEGWRVIGETVIEIRKKHGIGESGGGDNTNTAYADDIKLCGLDVVVTPTLRNAAIYAEHHEDFSVARATLKKHLAKLPKDHADAKAITKALGWSSVSMVNKVIKGYIDDGLDGAMKRIRKETDRTKKGAHERKPGDGGTKPTTIEGMRSKYYNAGIDFRNMMSALSKMTPKEQDASIGAFFGTTQHNVKLTRTGNKVRVVEDGEANAVDRARFDVTITFHSAKGGAS